MFFGLNIVPLGQGNHTDGPGKAEGGEPCSVDGVHGDVHFGRGRGAEVFSVEEHGASSFSPSLMTTMPDMETVLSM
ncbi:hypothetical protein MASR2M79_12680 [Aminivibrio sp.]